MLLVRCSFCGKKALSRNNFLSEWVECFCKLTITILLVKMCEMWWISIAAGFQDSKIHIHLHLSVPYEINLHGVDQSSSILKYIKSHFNELELEKKAQKSGRKSSSEENKKTQPRCKEKQEKKNTKKSTQVGKFMPKSTEGERWERESEKDVNRNVI